MNERIKQLILKAGFHPFVRGEQILFDISTEENLKEFAELIVRECASLMESEKDYYSKPGSYESREYYERMSAKEDAFDDAARMIKSHFGVEE
jgi:hypothetical protein